MSTFPPNVETFTFDGHRDRYTWRGRNGATVLPENVCTAMPKIQRLSIDCDQIQGLHNTRHLTNLKHLVLKVNILSVSNVKAIYETRNTLESLHIHIDGGRDSVLNLATFSKLLHVVLSGPCNPPKLPQQLQSLCYSVNSHTASILDPVMALPNLRRLALEISTELSLFGMGSLARRLALSATSLEELQVNRYANVFSAPPNRSFTVKKVSIYEGNVSTRSS